MLLFMVGNYFAVIPSKEIIKWLKSCLLFSILVIIYAQNPPPAMKKISHVLLLLFMLTAPAFAQQNMSLLGKYTYSNDIGSLGGYADGNGNEISDHIAPQMLAHYGGAGQRTFLPVDPQDKTFLDPDSF